MSLLFLIVGIAVIGGVVLLATGRMRGELPDVVTGRSLEGLPESPVGALTPEQVGDVRIDQSLRGYRMDEVDELVDRLTAEIAARDEVIADQGAELASLRVSEPSESPDTSESPDSSGSEKATS